MKLNVNEVERNLNETCAYPVMANKKMNETVLDALEIYTLDGYDKFVVFKYITASFSLLTNLGVTIFLLFLRKRLNVVHEESCIFVP